MKKVLLLLLAFGFMSSLCFAQVTATELKKGKVESVSLADTTKGTKSEVVITDEAGKKYGFLVKSTTTIYASDWKAISLDKVNKGDSIKIKYTTSKEGVNEALSVNVLK